jgi:creatinine amidohydrolase
MMVLMNELSWPEYAARIKDGAVILLPCGALEQHGPHLPLGVDVILSTAIATGVAKLVDGLVAHPLTYGYKSMPRSGGGSFFPGTVNLDGSTLSAVVRDIIREFARHGVRGICLIDGHYENQWFLTEGIDLALRDIGSNGPKVIRLEYWDFVDEATLASVFPGEFPGFALEHAAVLETSLMLYLCPHLVRVNLIPDHPPARSGSYDVTPPHRHWVPDSGALSSAKAASAEKGKTLFDHHTTAIAQILRSEFQLNAPREERENEQRR